MDDQRNVKMACHGIRQNPLGRYPECCAAALALLLAVALVCSCSGRDDWVGQYEAVSQTADGKVTHTLELQADGKGFWSAESDNAPLRWDVHQNTIRLHTPSGGVVQGTLERSSLQIAIPGQGVIQFTKVR